MAMETSWPVNFNRLYLEDWWRLEVAESFMNLDLFSYGCVHTAWESVESLDMLPNIGCGPPTAQFMAMKHGKDDDDWMGLGLPPILKPRKYRWWCQCGHNKLLWACATLAVGKTQHSLSGHDFLKQRMAKTLWCATTNNCMSPLAGAVGVVNGYNQGTLMITKVGI